MDLAALSGSLDMSLREQRAHTVSTNFHVPFILRTQRQTHPHKYATNRHRYFPWKWLRFAPERGTKIEFLPRRSQSLASFYTRPGSSQQYRSKELHKLLSARLANGLEANDEPAATAGEDRRTTGQTCELLLAIAGGRTSDAAAVRGDARPDRAATDTDGIGGPWSSRQRNPSINWLGQGEVLQK